MSEQRRSVPCASCGRSAEQCVDETGRILWTACYCGGPTRSAEDRGRTHVARSTYTTERSGR